MKRKTFLLTRETSASCEINVACIAYSDNVKCNANGTLNHGFWRAGFVSVAVNEEDRYRAPVARVCAAIAGVNRSLDYAARRRPRIHLTRAWVRVRA